MCTGFIYKDNDVIFAYNLDISEQDFNYKLIKNDNVFTICIKVGSTSYYTHGINKNKNFGVLPFMNDNNKYINNKYKRIDLLINDLIRNKIDIDYINTIKDTSNIKLGSLHAICGNNNIKYLIEPGSGLKQIDKYQVISNYPLLKQIKYEDNLYHYYGIERYNIINNELSKINNLTITKAFDLLKKVSQTGNYSTKLSFAYSTNENKIYYCLNNDFDNIQIHDF